MKRVLLLGVLAGALSGCAMQTFTAVKPRLLKKDNLSVGVIQAVSVGEPILSQRDAYISPAFEVAEDIPPLKGETGVEIPAIPAGTRMSAVLMYGDGSYLCFPGPEHSLSLDGGIVSVPLCLVVEVSGRLVGFAACSNVGRPTRFANATVNLRKAEIFTKGSSHKELLYNGKLKDAIKVTYREYYGDMARPAYFQDLTYDLSESNVIGFKGVKLEILDAGNSQIKYRVVQSGEM